MTDEVKDTRRVGYPYLGIDGRAVEQDGEVALLSEEPRDVYVPPAEGADEQPRSRRSIDYVEHFIRSVAEAENWPSRLAELEGQLHVSPMAFENRAVMRLRRLIHAAQMMPVNERALVDARRVSEGETPPVERRSKYRVQPLLVARLRSRDRKDAPPIPVPTLTALFAGEMPVIEERKPKTQSDEVPKIEERKPQTQLGLVLYQIAEKWYGCDLKLKHPLPEMAEALGMSEVRLEALVWGKALCESYEKLALLASKLEVNPALLVVPWFADFKKKRGAAPDPEIYFEPSEMARRAQDLVDLAAERLRAQEKGWSVYSDFTINKAVQLCYFCMSAGVHPRIVVPTIAGATIADQKFFKDVESYAEARAARGHLWEAALACFLASHHAEADGGLQQVLAMTAKGNRYLKEARRLAFLSTEVARNFRVHYLKRALRLYDGVVQHLREAPGELEQFIIPNETVKDMRRSLQGLNAQRKKGEPSAGDESLTEVAIEGMAGITPLGWNMLDQLKHTSPSYYRAIQDHNAWAIVQAACRVMQKTRTGYMGFLASVHLMLTDAGYLKKGGRAPVIAEHLPYMADAKLSSGSEAMNPVASQPPVSPILNAVSAGLIIAGAPAPQASQPAIDPAKAALPGAAVAAGLAPAGATLGASGILPTAAGVVQPVAGAGLLPSVSGTMPGKIPGKPI
jgi:hypothetical protein